MTHTCRFCDAPLSHSFIDLGMSPLANSYVSPNDTAAEPFFPLCAYVCQTCLLVQLPVHESAAKIFDDYAYFSSYSDSWLRHAQSYVEQVTERFGFGVTTQVVELASNDGYLLQYFKARGIPVLGIEPARNVASVAQERGIETIVKYFGQQTAQELAASGRRADLLIGNNVLAHVPDLNDFVAGMKTLLSPGGIITIEFPHLMQLVNHCQFDTIYHEHFSYFSFLVVAGVFAHHGLRVFDVEELPTHGGSLRVYACHEQNGALADTVRVAGLLQRESSEGYDDFARYLTFEPRVRSLKQSIVTFMDTVRREGNSIAGYGAAAKGNTLLNYCGIDRSLMEYVVDRSPHKQGMLLPGTHIPIRGPAAIAQAHPDYLVILPWNIKDEIMEQMAYVREWGCKFVTFIPDVKVHP
ncbi:MAG: methyltransferase domain-containing protein [Chitinivibrionales bacterium]|nr:methyltransferase domain-containing protein [Chitinivibrionales bacterium]